MCLHCECPLELNLFEAQENPPLQMHTGEGDSLLNKGNVCRGLKHFDDSF